MPPLDRHDGPDGARVYRLPVRAFPSLEANVYLVVDGAYTALIDTGSGGAESNADLEAGLAAVRAMGEDVSFQTLSRLILTHGHIDHYGGFDFVRARSQAPLAIHAYDRGVIEKNRERHLVVERGLRRFFQVAGLDAARVEAALTLYHGGREAFHGGPVQTVLQDGDCLDGRFRIHHVPGHCPGQVCLGFGDLLFSADHVLPRMFPHLAPESITPWTGLAHYLDALTTLARVPGVRLTLPGHGRPITDLPGRIAQLRASNDRKLARVRAACAESPKTIQEITQALYPHVPGYESLLALEKVGAYVEYLDQIGVFAIANLDDFAADEACAPRYGPVYP